MATHLKSLQALVIAAKTGSLAASAEILGITPAAVGQRIKTLEEYLGLELLVRGRFGISPTPYLIKALDHLNLAFDQIEKATEVLDFQRVFEIHIVAEISWAEMWLKPRLPDFQKDHPNIKFCINGIGDIPSRVGQSDFEIRFGSREPDVEADYLFNEYLLPVCSPKTNRRSERFSKDKWLESHMLIHITGYESDPSSIGWPEWIKEHDYKSQTAARGLRYKNAFAALGSIESNVGPMICGLSLILDRLAAGALALPFPISQGAWTEHCFQLKIRKESKRRPQIQAFRDWLLHQSQKTTETMREAISEA